jgi:hypothetical protein
MMSGLGASAFPGPSLVEGRRKSGHAEGRMRVRITIAVLCLTAVTILPGSGPRPVRAQAITVSAGDLLEYYGAGEYDVVRRALTEAASGDLGVVLEALQRNAPAWIDADGPGGRDRRRMIAATFALEAAQASLADRWERSRAMIEWASGLLAKSRPSERERIWHLAALALCEGAGDVVAIDAQLARMERRFPGEPRIVLGRAFIGEIPSWEAHAGYLGGGDPDRAVKPLQAALSQGAIRDEALLRLGYLLLYGKRPEEALGYLRQISSSTDAGQAYLAALFAGWAHERLGQPYEAIREFRSALVAVPRAHTASFSLAARLYAVDAREEADRVVEEALHSQEPVEDPWRIYGYGDLRLFPMLVDQLRKAFT